MENTIAKVVRQLEDLALYLDKSGVSTSKRFQTALRYVLLIKHEISRLGYDQEKKDLEVLQQYIVQEDISNLKRSTEAMRAHFNQILLLVQNEHILETRTFVKKCPHCGHIGRE